MDYLWCSHFGTSKHIEEQSHNRSGYHMDSLSVNLTKR